MRPQQPFALVLLALILSVIAGCELDIAEDEVITSDTAIREGTPGVFKDSEVGGVNYLTSSGLGGTTDSKGQFYYNPGDTVSFSLGGISLGSVKAAAVLTPVAVIGATDTSDPRVVNMSRLLQSLDADGDPSNGIGISESTRESLETTEIDFDQPVAVFESSASAVVSASVGRPMVSVQQAMTHLHNTMKDEGLDNNVADESKFSAIAPNFDGNPPKLVLDKGIPTYLKERQPKITINADEAGSIRYLGNCSGDKSSIVVGDNEITLNSLADGFYRCGLVVTDDVGNNSDKLFFGNFTVDTVSPKLKVSAQVFPLTNDNTPEFVISASEASTIIYGGGCQSQTAEAVAGENRITLNRLADGEYSQCTLQLKDPSGHSSSVVSLTSFTVDTVSPTLKLLSGISDFTNTSTPSIRFRSDEAGTLRYLDDCRSSVDQVVAGENTITLNALTDGQYAQCRFIVTDSAGNAGALRIANFVVDTTPLAVRWIAKIPSATQDTTPSFAFNVSEASTIAYSGGCTSEATKAVPGDNEITLKELGDGTYSDCRIQLSDAAGNQSPSYSVALYDSFRVDTTPPTLSLSQSLASHVNDSTPSLVFSSTEDLRVTYAGSCSGDLTRAVAGDNTLVLNELSDGAYTDCELKVRDLVGNTATLSLGSFTVDTVAPSLSVTSSIPTSGNDATPSFSMEASEASNIGYSGACGSSASAVQAGDNEITLNKLGDDTYTDCKIQLSDSAGNQSGSYTFESFLVDTTAPALSLTTAIPSYVNDSTPHLIFTSAEAGTISYENTCSSAATAASVGTNEITLNSLSDGPYTDCRLKVIDAVGNVGTLSLGSFTVDTVAPSLSLTTAIASTGNDATPSFVINASEASNIGYSGACTSNTSAVQAGDNEITLNKLGDGTYADCKIQLSDSAGNQSNLHPFASFLVDTTAPALSLTTAISSHVNDPTPSFEFTSTESGTISYVGSCSSTSTSAIAGVNEITLNNLSDGPYADCQLKVVDAVGNVATLSIGSFTIDTISPSLVLTSAVPTKTNDVTPSLSFSSNEAGEISYASACSSVTSSANVGGNTITLNSLSDGNYSDCELMVTDAAGNAASLALGSFAIDATAPVLSMKQGIPSFINESSPFLIFSSSEPGTISYSGSCSSSTTQITEGGQHTIALNQLSEGYYHGCSLSVTDSSGNTSTPLSIAPFTIDLTPPVGNGALDSLGKIAGSPTAYLNLNATDQNGITGYCISVNSMDPSTSSSCWISINSTINFTQSSVPYAYGNVDTVYIWYKDASLNISTGFAVDVSSKPPRPENLQAHYQGSEPITSKGQNLNWSDQSGNNHTITNFRSTPSQATVDGTKFGLASPGSIQVIQGDENSGFSLPFAMNSGSYTIAYMARYTGDKNDTTYNKRIFDSQSGTGQKTLWGFHGGVAGRSHNGEKGWYTNTDYKMSEPDTWIIGVETEVSSRFNGMDFTNHYQQSGTTYPRRPSAGFNPTLTVNYGYYHGSESSRWQVAELIVWNTELSEVEQIEAEEYLAQKYSHTSFESVKASLNDYKNHFASSVADGWYGIYDGAQVGYGDGGWYTGLGKFFELNDKWYWGYALTNGSQAGAVSYSNRNGANQIRSWKAPSFEHGNYKLHAIVNGGGGGGGRARGSGGGAGGMSYFLNRSYNQTDFQVEVGARGSWGGLWKSNQNGPGGDSMLSWSISGSNQYMRGYGGYEGVDGCYNCTVSGGGYDGNSKDGGGNGGGSYSYSSQYGQQGGMPYEPNVTVGGQNTLSEIAKAYGVSYRIGRYWWWSDYVWGNGGAGSRYGVGMDRYARDGFYGGYGWVLFIMDANSY